MHQRYVVIDPGFEGADAQPLRWLGRVVARMDTPSVKYAPFETDLRPLLSRFILGPTHEINALVFAKAIGDKNLKLKLMNWINLTSGTTDQKALEIHSPRITTFSLQQHSAFLEALQQQGGGVSGSPIDDVLRLLQAVDRKAYMVVGVKLLYNATISLTEEEKTQRDISLTLPVVEAIMLATGAPLSKALLAANPQGHLSTNQENSNDVVYTLERPRIFALEYREVTYKRSFFRRLSTGLDVSMQAPTQKKSHYVFAPTGTEEKDGKQPTTSELRGGKAGDEKSENEMLLVKDADISLADINDEVDWSIAIVDISGNESEPCMLIHELEEVGSEDL